MKYFWTYKTDLPADFIGTPNFSSPHLACILASILLIVAMLLIYRRQDAKVKIRMQKFIIVLAAVLDVARWIWAAIIGHYSFQEMLPLHLCSLSIWMELAAVFTGRSLLKEFGYALCMTGAMAAILTPDWSMYPFPSFQYLHSIVVHSLLILVPVLWIWGDGFRPNYRQLPKCLLILFAFAIPVFFINFAVDGNYLFLREAPKDTPIEIFDTWFGNPGYLVPLFFTIMVVWLVFYLPWMIIGKMHSVHKSKIADSSADLEY